MATDTEKHRRRRGDPGDGRHRRDFRALDQFGDLHLPDSFPAIGRKIYPPELCKRREYIPLLIDHSMKRHAETNHQEARRFLNEAMRLLLGSEWPGNVRELENAVEHALAIGTGPTLRIPDLPPHINGLVGKMGAAEIVGEARALREVERRHSLRILEETGGNHAPAAEVLGIDRRTLYRKLNKYKV